MSSTTTLDRGQVAPDFKLKGPGGQPVTLSEYRGQKNVVLVFYPLAFSGTCSHQLPEVQAAVPRIEELDSVVFGISVDSHYANTAFAKHLGLTFTLLSDFRHEASLAYGVFSERFGTSGRATFVIDKRGIVVHRDVSEAPGDVEGIPSIEKVVEVLKSLT
jgi:peroxiredoxin (alkyl hydroperoxide reductase subunit C)